MLTREITRHRSRQQGETKYTEQFHLLCPLRLRQDFIAQQCLLSMKALLDTNSFYVSSREPGDDLCSQFFSSNLHLILHTHSFSCNILISLIIHTHPAQCSAEEWRGDNCSYFSDWHWCAFNRRCNMRYTFIRAVLLSSTWKHRENSAVEDAWTHHCWILPLKRFALMWWMSNAFLCHSSMLR